MNTNQRTCSVLGAATVASVVLFLAGCADDGSSGYGAPGGGEAGTSGGVATAPATPGESDSPAAPGSSDVPTEDVLIVIKDFSYTVPDAVPAGSTITVRNDDAVGHTVTSDDDGVFDVVVGPGEEAQLTAPAQSGEYPFHCTPHPSMTSTLVVGEPGDQSPAADDPSTPAY